MTEVAVDAKAASRSQVLLLVPQSMDVEQKVVRVYESLRSPVYQYLATIVGDLSWAEDITQETFLRLFVYWTNHGTIADDRVRSWVFRVAHNLAVDRIRNSRFVSGFDSEAAMLQLPDSGHNPEETLLEQERFDFIRNRLACLSKQEQRCLYLRAEGFRYREIAEILSITSSSVAEFLRRAIRKLMRDTNEQSI